MSLTRTSIIAAAMTCLTALASAGAWAQWSPAEDQVYIEDFLDYYTLADPLLGVEDYIEAESSNYQKWMGNSLEAEIAEQDDGANIPHWSVARRMISLNRMYDATGDDQYLVGLMRLIEAVLEARDDRRDPPLAMHTGEVATAWGDPNRTELGRVVYSVHTGMVVYPILEFLLLSEGNMAVEAEMEPGQREAWVELALEAFDFHERDWRNGPGEGEGHYVFTEENEYREWLHEQCVPANYLSALGRAAWMAWRVSEEQKYYDRAVELATYLRRRMSPATDGGLYWGYWLSVDPVPQTPLDKDEIPQGWTEVPRIDDISHGALTSTFAIMMGKEGIVFDEADLESLSHTVTEGFARLDNGILFGRIHGDPGSAPPREAQGSSNFLGLALMYPEVYERISDWFRMYEPNPSPEEIAELIAYNPANQPANAAGHWSLYP